MKITHGIFIIATALVLTGEAQGEIVVSTMSASPGALLAGGIGLEIGPRVNWYSMGQSLTAPAGSSTLNEFSIMVAHQDFIPPGHPANPEVPLLVRGVVMQFAGSTAVGSPLYISDVFTVPLNNFAFQVVTVDTNNLPVVAGVQYGLLLSIIDVAQTGYNRVHVPVVGNLVGGSGLSSDRVLASNASSFAAAAGGAWPGYVLGASLDTIFEARFNVPAGASVTPFALTLLAYQRRRPRRCDASME